MRFDVNRLGANRAATAERAADAVGGRVARSFDRWQPVFARWCSIPVPTSSRRQRGSVPAETCCTPSPNYLVRAAGIPNDSRFGEQWGLHNTGQTVRGTTGTADADIDAPEAWNVTTGSPAVTVAVLDSGVAYDHPDLAPNMWVNTDEVAGNGVDDDHNGFVDDRRGWDVVSGDNDPTDENGHGTHVAGTIGARGNNDTPGGGTTDVVGVAQDVRLMPVRVLNEVGEGTNVGLIEGIEYARANGARIANLSLSSWNFSAALRDTIAAATDITFVVAAGNDHDKNLDEGWTVYPCSFDLPNIVCVAATDNRDQLAGFSNWGPVTVDVAAPGVDVLSTKAYTRIFFDDFETANSQWVFGGTPNTWGRTTNVPLGATGTWLTDSPNGNYPSGNNNWARTPALNLTGLRDCAVQFHALVDTESWFDFVYVEAATSPSGPWVQAGDRFSGFLDAGFDQRIPDQFNGDSDVYVRIRLNEDGAFDAGDGIYLDNFAVQCAGRYSAGSYEYLSGTSMATPHVSGVAALVLARNPGFTPAHVKGRLLTSVDTKASLADKVVSGGRINAFRAVNSTITNRPPTANAGPDKTVAPGSTVTLSGTGSDPDGGTLSTSGCRSRGRR